MKIETQREDDGRWIAEVSELPGVMAYGTRRDEAIARAQALVLRVIADRLEHGDDDWELQMKRDAAAGKFDKLIKESEAEYREGRTTKLECAL